MYLPFTESWLLCWCSQNGRAFLCCLFWRCCVALFCRRENLCGSWTTTPTSAKIPCSAQVPCPSGIAWTGLSCRSEPTNPPRLTIGVLVSKCAAWLVGIHGSAAPPTPVQAPQSSICTVTTLRGVAMLGRCGADSWGFCRLCGALHVYVCIHQLIEPRLRAACRTL